MCNFDLHWYCIPSKSHSVTPNLCRSTLPKVCCWHLCIYCFQPCNAGNHWTTLLVSIDQNSQLCCWNTEQTAGCRMYLGLVWTNPILKPSRECSGDVFQVAQKMTAAIGGGWEQEATWHMFPYYFTFTTSPTTKIMFFLWVFIHIGKLCQCQCFHPMSRCNCEISQTSTDALGTTLGSNLSRCNESRHWVGPLSLQAMHKHGRKSLEWHCALCSYI